MRIAALVLVSTLAFMARPAQADCVDRASCLCFGSVRSAVDGVILSATDSQAELRVDAIDGDTSVAAVGSTLTIARGTVRQNERWLAVQTTYDDQWYPVSAVKSDGNIDCIHVPEIVLSASDALDLSVATNCHALFEGKASEQGIGPQQCKDTIDGSGGFLGTLFGCRCSSGSALSLLALVPLVLRRRRARR
jgi:hypothetical protein